MRNASLFLLSSLLAGAPALADTTVVPPQEHPVLRDIVAAVSADQLQQNLTKLVGFGTRHTLSDTKSDTQGIGAARRWVQSRFQTISKDCGGCLEVITPSRVFTGERMPKAGAEVMDVVAIQKGHEANRYLVMTAHLDSRVTDIMNAGAVEPGADDDGSGVAAILEAARVLSKYKFNATIVYSVDSGEEQGLYGGQLIADYARDHHWNVESDFNNDIVGNSRGQNGVVDNTTVRVFSPGISPNVSADDLRYIYYHGGEVDSPSREVARMMEVLGEQYIPNWHVMMVYRTDRFGRGGDQVMFLQNGFPAVRVSEAHEDYTRQHQDIRVENGIHYGDVLSGVDFSYLAKVTAMNAITLAALAWAPPPPSGVQVEGAVKSDTTLNWKPMDGDAAEDLAGYRVYWRLTTAPLWDKSLYIGDAQQAVLKDIVIDDFFFGVASVSKEGFESPVVFPGPTGAFW